MRQVAQGLTPSRERGASTLYNGSLMTHDTAVQPTVGRSGSAASPDCSTFRCEPVSSYANEQDLVDDFLDHLSRSSPWGRISTRPEFPYQSGRTDIVAVDEAGHVLAFEAKLLKWRNALQQAYRNTCFAHRSYVVLPKEVAMRASRAGAAFNSRQVGICYLEDGVQILQEAAVVKPLQPWLSARATQHVIGGQGNDASRRPD